MAPKQGPLTGLRVEGVLHPPPLGFAQVDKLRASGHKQGVLGGHIFKDAFGSTFPADT